jgi:hypothetical protein
LSTFGDDVLGASRDVSGVGAIDNLDVQVVAARLGMKFGPIDKETTYLPPYYGVGEVTFLKCSDTFVPRLDRRAGMIAQSSVRKCLTFERNMDFEARRNTAESALRLFYVRAVVEGREDAFNQLREQFLEALSPGTENAVEREGLLPDLERITEGLMSADKASPAACLDDVWETV